MLLKKDVQASVLNQVQPQQILKKKGRSWIAEGYEERQFDHFEECRSEIGHPLNYNHRLAKPLLADLDDLMNTKFGVNNFEIRGFIEEISDDELYALALSALEKRTLLELTGLLNKFSPNSYMVSNFVERVQSERIYILCRLAIVTFKYATLEEQDKLREELVGEFGKN